MASILTLGAIGDYFVWWQIPLVIVLIIILVAWMLYRRKQL